MKLLRFIELQRTECIKQVETYSVENSHTEIDSLANKLSHAGINLYIKTLKQISGLVAKLFQELKELESVERVETEDLDCFEN